MGPQDRLSLLQPQTVEGAEMAKLYMNLFFFLSMIAVIFWKISQAIKRRTSDDVKKWNAEELEKRITTQ
jgi:hypothetical protein